MGGVERKLPRNYNFLCVQYFLWIDVCTRVLGVGGGGREEREIMFLASAGRASVDAHARLLPSKSSEDALKFQQLVSYKVH